MAEILDIEKLKKVAKKHTLRNSVKYGGDPNINSVTSSILGSHPEYRPYVDEVRNQITITSSELSDLSIEERMEYVKEYDTEFYVHLGEKKEKVHELPELEGAESGVVMRLAPNPSGPLHIGHTRMAILNDEYVKRYNGKLIVRMEDTNPPTIMPEAYDAILQALDWLGVEYHEVVNQSSRFNIYYEYAEKLLKSGHAYVCNCPPDNWRNLKEEGKPCQHRDLEPGTHLDLWEKMLAGEYKPGEISLMIKTDLNHSNPAVRDFVALRLVDEPHPLTGDDFRVYPLYNFSVAIDDHLMDMTHVLRGKDHLNNTLRQEYVYDYLGWTKPQFHHYGWVSIEDTELSTRKIKTAIEEGKYFGWNDVRLGTVTALERRGIQPAAIRRYWIEVGIKGVDIKFSWQNLYAYNKEIIDPIANRYSFVPNPVPIIIHDVERLECHAPLHPDYPDRGTRDNILEKDGDGIHIYVSKNDYDETKSGKLRFKDLGNIQFKGKEVKFLGTDLEFVKDGIHIINWAPIDALDAVVILENGRKLWGKVEKFIKKNEKTGNIVQFERVGFVKLEFGDNIEAYFAHK